MGTRWRLYPDLPREGPTGTNFLSPLAPSVLFALIVIIFGQLLSLSNRGLCREGRLRVVSRVVVARALNFG